MPLRPGHRPVRVTGIAMVMSRVVPIAVGIVRSRLEDFITDVKAKNVAIAS
jgi:hypothetical protein